MPFDAKLANPLSAGVLKGMVDTEFLINSTFFILDKDSRLSPFIFNEVQRHYWPRITRRDIVLKSRKMGFTTLRVARMVAKIATMEYRRCILVSHEEEATKRILGRAVEMVKNCLTDLGIKTTENTLTCARTKSSLYIGTAGAKAFGRGDDITDYHLTEFAWWSKPDLITGIEEGCVRDSEGCIESTAKGYGTPFHDLWVRAKKQEAGMVKGDGVPMFYTPHFYAWWQDSTLEADCPRPLEDLNDYERRLRDQLGVNDRKLLWRRLKVSAMADPLMFPQEYPATPEEAFLVTGSMVFDSMALAQHEQMARPVMWTGEIRDDGQRVRMEPSDRGRLTIWRVPKPEGRYIMTGDVASGVSDGCWSVWDIWDTGNNEQVAQWRGRTPPDLFGDAGCLVGAYYNYALLVPEVNNHGLSTCHRIRDNKYPNLYRRESNTGGTDLGFYTSPGRNGTKIELVNKAREYVRDFQFRLNSPRTISEMRTFVVMENGEMDHMEKAYSDCVITAGIGAIMLSKVIGEPEDVEPQVKDRVIRGGLRNRVSAPSFKTGYQ